MRATKALTNSLAATDEPAAHAGYSHYRRDLLEGGVQLFELQPQVGSAQAPTVGGTSSGTSLHAKAVVVDRRYVFIGSMNMDLRSKLLNTEMGVIVDCPALATAVGQYFDRATSSANAFHVELHNQHMAAVWQVIGEAKTLSHEPSISAPAHRNFAVAVAAARWLAVRRWRYAPCRRRHPQAKMRSHLS